MGREGGRGERWVGLPYRVTEEIVSGEEGGRGEGWVGVALQGH